MTWLLNIMLGDTGNDMLTSGITNDEMCRKAGMKKNRGTSPIIRISGSVPYFFTIGYFDSDAAGAYKVEAIKFADGTVWDVDAVKAKVIVSSGANDTLNGGTGNDYIYGDGDDALDGGAGDGFLKSCQSANDAEWRVAA